MTPFEIELITALHDISKLLDMQVKQKEREIVALQDIADNIADLRKD